MLHLTRPRQAKRHESTVALINIVFLILIFFLIAGTLAPPPDPAIRLITTDKAPRQAPPDADALFITRDGAMRQDVAPVNVSEIMAEFRNRSGLGTGEPPAIRLVVDRALPATKLLDIITALKAQGAGRITIITRQSPS